MGGSKKQTVGYRYFLGMHMILCHGPIDRITSIYVDKKLAWKSNSTGGTISINQPNLLGGDEKEGGVVGSLDIDMGGPTQLKNSYLQSVLGTLIPAYRKVVGVILRDMYLGTSPYLKNWSFIATRVLKAADGQDQWNLTKASIPKDYEAGIPATQTFVLGSIFPNITSAQPGYPVPPGFYPATLTIGPFNETRRIIAGSGGARADDFFVLNGVQFPGPGFFTHPPGTIFATLDPGQTLNVQVLNTINFNTSAQGELLAVAIDSPEPDMNGVHIIRECLTNQDWGMGYQDSDIDDASFLAAADTIYEEKLGISLLWDRSMSIEDFIKEVSRHIDCSLYVSRTTGKFTIKLIRNDYDVGSLLVLDKSNISSVTNPNRQAFGELSNSVTVKFWDNASRNEDAITVSDTALARIQGQSLLF